MTTTNKFISSIAVLAVIAFAFTLYSQAKADASNIIPATVATTSNPAVTTNTVNLLFATSSCVSRTISTASSSLMLTFTDRQGSVPTAGFGFYQAASTTVTYDASQFGCGALKAYSFNTGVVTVQEAR